MENVDMPPSALRKIAAELETLARQYRSRAATLDQWAANRAVATKHLDKAANSGSVMKAYMAQGFPYEQALSATVQSTGMPAETVEHYWRKSNKADNKAEADRRAIEILRLAGRGWTNRQIADHFEIHPNSVSRIISKKIRKT